MPLPIWISAVLKQQLRTWAASVHMLKSKLMQLRKQRVRDESAKFPKLLVTEIAYKAQGSLDVNTG